MAGAALVLVTNVILPPLERGRKLTKDVIYAELNDESAINGFLDQMKVAYEIDSVRVQAAKSGLPGHIGFELEVPADSRQKTEEIYTEIRQLPYVAFAMEQNY